MKAMKKLLLILTCALLFPYLSNAGGIVTNTNQSATWVRTMVRDASTALMLYISIRQDWYNE